MSKQWRKGSRAENKWPKNNNITTIALGFGAKTQKTEGSHQHLTTSADDHLHGSCVSGEGVCPHFLAWAINQSSLEKSHLGKESRKAKQNVKSLY